MSRIKVTDVYPELKEERDYFYVSGYEPMVSAFGQRTKEHACSNNELRMLDNKTKSAEPGVMQCMKGNIR